jgi:hypothetical protein
MDDDQAGGPDRVRLPGHDEPPGYRPPAYTWPRDDYGTPDGYGPPGGYWPGYTRDGGIRSSRRASSWTAAALIAGVAATTGYLAHSIPATGTSSGTGQAAHKHKSHGRTVVRAPSAPVVQAPVVTSGGSGAAGGGGGGGD